MEPSASPIAQQWTRSFLVTWSVYWMMVLAALSA
jgi:hypothetical protein